MSPPSLFNDAAQSQLPGSGASARRSRTGHYARPIDHRSIGGGTANSPFGCRPSRPLGRSRVRLPPSLRFILRPEPRQPTRCARREESAVKETQEILLRRHPDLPIGCSWASSSGSAIRARQGIRRRLHFGKGRPLFRAEAVAGPLRASTRCRRKVWPRPSNPHPQMS
jgi:hypothetical protein